VGATRASLPRFKRIQAPPRIELTEDDVAILRHLLRHRFIRTTDLFRLLDHRSPDKLSRRLARLYRARLIDRPLSQIDHFRGAGSQPLVYGLDNAGARFLASHTNMKVSSGDWTRRNGRYTRENLDHTLAVTRFMIDLELACRAREDVDLVHLEDISESASGSWSVILPWHGSQTTVTVAPDAIFGLRMRTPEGRQLRSFYFLELDRGTMTITPNESVRRSDAFLYRSSVLRKLLAYTVSHRDKMHQGQLAIPAARILMLTASASRAEEMRLAAEQRVIGPMKAPKGLFLFASQPLPNPLGQTFLNVSGEATQLGVLEV
jgi:hypothetical protein